MSTTAHTSGDITHGVPATPTRGYLTHVTGFDGTDTVITTTGWFSTTANGGVARRKIGGRNTSLFTTQGRIIAFVADTTAK